MEGDKKKISHYDADFIKEQGVNGAITHYRRVAAGRLISHSQELYDIIKDGDMTLKQIADKYNTYEDVVFFYLYFEAIFEPIKYNIVAKYPKPPYPLNEYRPSLNRFILPILVGERIVSHCTIARPPRVPEEKALRLVVISYYADGVTTIISTAIPKVITRHRFDKQP